jgi:glyoxylase-like metal-dependent hydrolase (beta-lactamase superfamily II)
VEEIAPGLWHWTARHDRINMDVSSYYLLPERVVIDPLIPPEGLEWFKQREPPEHVLLTNRHHDRHAWRLSEAFNCTVHCIRNGLHELEGRGSVEAFDFGDELPGGAVAFEVDAICPDETALHFAAKRALACADGVVRGPGASGLSFVPDQLMDDPEQTKAGLRDAYRRLLDLDLDFELLLLAHGEPIVAGGKEALLAFVHARP